LNQESKDVDALEVKEHEDAEIEETIVQDEPSDTVETVTEYDAEEHIKELENTLAEAEVKAAEYLDGWQRARAEFANARKRLERERADAHSRAAIDHAKKVLPVIDDFDRALSNVPENVEQDTWFEGIQLVNRKIHSILQELRVESIEAVGQPFDPNYHEALSLQEVDGVESGIVVEEIQSGFRLGDKVIRPALVNVAA
jgi:molecular chaperone GrpE